jgi:hypothetical protein
VPADEAAAASFFTAVLGLTCWVGAVYARCTYTEPWSALANCAAILLYLRARSSGRARDAALVGAALGLALLVKYTYGLQLAAAIGVTGLVQLLVRERRAETIRGGSALLLGLAAVLAWWFLLPLPYGFPTGQAHAKAFGLYLTKAADLPTLGPEFVLVAWPLMSFLSFAAVLLQLAAFAWGAVRWRSEAHRLCLLLGVIGPIAFAAYPFRIDRFLIPALPAGWALAGGLAAAAIARFSPRLRLAAGAALLLLLVGTAGLGAERVLRLAFPDLPAPIPAATAANLAAWRNPYAFRTAPGGGPEGTEAVLRFAVSHLDAREPFAWIGGTGTEIPLALVQWTLFAASGETAALWREPDAQDHFWQDPGWSEADFRAWAARFPQLVTLDPPDPRDRAGREFERAFVAWMRAGPGLRGRGAGIVRAAGPGRPARPRGDRLPARARRYTLTSESKSAQRASSAFREARARPSTPKPSTQKEAAAVPCSIARRRVFASASPAAARYPMNPPANESPAPVGSTTSSTG